MAVKVNEEALKAWFEPEWDRQLYLAEHAVRIIREYKFYRKVMNEVPDDVFSDLNALDLMTEMPDIPEGFWPVAVETGISDSYNVEIISGVEEGTSVFMSKVMTEMW